MKIFIRILLCISVGFNIFFIWAMLRIQNNKSQSEIFGGAVNETTWMEGLESFIAKVKKEDKYGANKKYYYVNVWTTWCFPCIREMPLLDSLAGTLNKDIGYIFVSDQKDKVITDFLSRKKINVKNFIFLNDMNDFVSGICNEMRVRNKVYPMTIILDQKGKIFHYSVGSCETTKELTALASLIGKLP
jgi:thiol-disulfide isomerase/thioredoxin